MILSQSARHRTRGRLVNFDENAAALLKRELDQTFHHFHHQNTSSPAR
jgi:ribosomal protein L14